MQCKNSDDLISDENNRNDTTENSNNTVIIQKYSKWKIFMDFLRRIFYCHTMKQEKGENELPNSELSEENILYFLENDSPDIFSLGKYTKTIAVDDEISIDKNILEIIEEGEENNEGISAAKSDSIDENYENYENNDKEIKKSKYYHNKELRYSKFYENKNQENNIKKINGWDYQHKKDENSDTVIDKLSEEDCKNDESTNEVILNKNVQSIKESEKMIADIANSLKNLDISCQQKAIANKNENEKDQELNQNSLIIKHKSKNMCKNDNKKLKIDESQAIINDSVLLLQSLNDNNFIEKQKKNKSIK